MDTTAQQSPALKRFYDQLKTSGMSEESIGFFMGKVMKLAGELVMVEAVRVIGKEGVAAIDAIADKKEQRKQLLARFKEKKGTSLLAFQDEVVERLVGDFERAA